MRRRLKAKRRRISDIQITHPSPRSFEPLGLYGDVTNRIGETVDTSGDGKATYAWGSLHDFTRKVMQTLNA